MTLALACRLNPCARSIRATVRSDTRCPPPANASARLRVDFVVHTSGEVGSPRVCGSTSARKAGASPGSFSVAGLRPPPGARTRPAGSTPPSSSRTPLATVSGCTPVASSNRLDPAPAQLRRLRAEQQAALPLVQIRTQHRIAPSHRLVGLPLTRHSTTVDPPGTKTYSISSRVLQHPVLLVRMNVGLAVGDAVLKKTGDGEPFHNVRRARRADRAGGGEIVVRLSGVDIYSPTTGVIRSNDTSRDRPVDGRHRIRRGVVLRSALLLLRRRRRPCTGGRAPLQADIDQAGWATMSGAHGRDRFRCRTTGKIAVKVINHYGDEVLKVFELAASDAS